MPIRAAELPRYPSDWSAVSLAVKEAADWRCACPGDCGWSRHVEMVAADRAARTVEEERTTILPSTRCPAVHGEPSPFTGSVVVLTTAHLDQMPENCSEGNLRAMCQGCHLSYDRGTRAIRAQS